MILDHKEYRLDNLIYKRIMIGALAVCKITKVLVIKYQAENLKNQINFSIWFFSNDDGLLYLAMKNIFPALIIRFALRLTIVLNWKLHTVAFCKLLCLVPTFSLLPSNDFQLSLPGFRNPLPNPRGVIAVFQLGLKSLMVPCTLDPSYYTLAKTAATNEAIAVAMSEFVAKATDNEKELLRRHAVNLIENLKPLQSLYLKEHNLTTIAPVVRFPE